MTKHSHNSKTFNEGHQFEVETFSAMEGIIPAAQVWWTTFESDVLLWFL